MPPEGVVLGSAPACRPLGAVSALCSASHPAGTSETLWAVAIEPAERGGGSQGARAWNFRKSEVPTVGVPGTHRVPEARSLGGEAGSSCQARQRAAGISRAQMPGLAEEPTLFSWLLCWNVLAQLGPENLRVERLTGCQAAVEAPVPASRPFPQQPGCVLHSCGRSFQTRPDTRASRPGGAPSRALPTPSPRPARHPQPCWAPSHLPRRQRSRQVPSTHKLMQAGGTQALEWPRC